MVHFLPRDHYVVRFQQALCAATRKTPHALGHYFTRLPYRYSVKIYLLPCIGAYVGEALSLCCFRFVSKICCLCFGDMRFVDDEFPASSASLGEKYPTGENVTWIRAADLVAPAPPLPPAAVTVATHAGETAAPSATREQSQPQLFENGVDPSDVAQGSLGDCWLLSAISVLAEKDGQIQQIFWESTRSHWGKYHLKLYSGQQKKFVTVVVDDLIPCKEGAPLFTKPMGNEMWVLLLEKAFAKLLGSYGKLEGGMPLFALEAMTGDNVAHFKVCVAGAFPFLSIVHIIIILLGHAAGCSVWEVAKTRNGSP